MARVLGVQKDRLPFVSEDRVRVRIGDNGVATATMVRADKHNALDQAMFEGLVNAAEQLAGDTSVRAVVLHGEGKSFCSGLDVASFMGGEGGTGVLLARDDDRPANFAQRVTYDWSLVPAPVIAAIHGNCFGGGLQIALGADIRIAAADAKLSIMEIKWGLVPDMGITQTLPRLLPIDVAKELTFTGRIVSGSEGFELGLVTRIVEDPLSAALALAERDRAEIPGCGPRCEAPLRRNLDKQRPRGCPGARISPADRADRQAQPDRCRCGWNVGREAGFRSTPLTEKRHRTAPLSYEPAFRCRSTTYWFTKVPAGGSPLSHVPSDSPGRLIHR